MSKNLASDAQQTNGLSLKGGYIFKNMKKMPVI